MSQENVEVVRESTKLGRAAIFGLGPTFWTST